MGFFGKIRKAVSKLFRKNTIESTFGVRIAVSSKMEQAMQLWSEMFEDHPPWKNEEKGDKTLNLPAAIASEIARLVTVEMQSVVTGSARADYINTQYQPVIDSARRFTEFACAKGGVALKPYVAGDRVFVSVIQADDFYPTAFDSDGNVTAGVFTDYRYIEQYKYTRLEEHKMEGNTYTITNKVFRLSVSNVTAANDDALGTSVSLTDVADWAEIDPVVTVKDVAKPLFAYFKMPFANHIEPRSPLGVSVYSKASDIIREADKQWSEILWEYEAGEAAIHASSNLFHKDRYGNPILPKGRERQFRTFEFDRDQKIDPYHPEFRDNSLFNGLNRYIQKIEFLCGLAYGTISDPSTVDKTATEVKQSRQRSFSTVSDIQKALQTALEHLIYAIDTLTTLYGLAPEGDYEVSFEFDDSIIVDREVEFTRLMSMAAAQMIRPEKVVAWYFGVSEEEARKMLPDYAPEYDNELPPAEEE